MVIFLKRTLIVALCFLLGFILWTASLFVIDVSPLAPNGTNVGFSTLNAYMHNLTDVHYSLYILTDWLGLVPFAFAIGFAVLGLIQWCKRKNFLKVDVDILLLGAFYAVVIGLYLFFEEFVVNYRPILISGVAEVSYPSSTTMLTLCVMPTAIMQFNTRIKNNILKICVAFLLSAFTAFMVIGRLISGVHWFTDIVGGALLSAGLVLLYKYFVALLLSRKS